MATITFAFNRLQGEQPTNLLSSLKSIFTQAGMSQDKTETDGERYKRTYSSESNGGAVVRVSQENRLLHAWVREEDTLKHRACQAYVEYIGMPKYTSDAITAQITTRGQPQQAQPENGTYRPKTQGGKR